MTSTMSQKGFTVRVGSRRNLCAELLKPEHETRRLRVGLIEEDLKRIVACGNDAERYDRQQHEELADQRGVFAEGAKTWQAQCEDEDALRIRFPAVLMDLEADPSSSAHATWLGSVSFERFRVVTPRTEATAAAATATATEGWEADGTDRVAEQPPVKQRTARVDRLSRSQTLAHLGRSLLEPERAPILAAFERRGFARDRISQMVDRADGLVARMSSGQRFVRPDATQLEADAVAAQKRTWEACRRMIRAAIAGEPNLEKLWAAC